MSNMATARSLWLVWCGVWALVWFLLGFSFFPLWLGLLASVGAMFIPVGRSLRIEPAPEHEQQAAPAYGQQAAPGYGQQAPPWHKQQPPIWFGQQGPPSQQQPPPVPYRDYRDIIRERDNQNRDAH